MNKSNYIWIHPWAEYKTINSNGDVFEWSHKPTREQNRWVLSDQYNGILGSNDKRRSAKVKNGNPERFQDYYVGWEDSLIFIGANELVWTWDGIGIPPLETLIAIKVDALQPYVTGKLVGMYNNSVWIVFRENNKYSTMPVTYSLDVIKMKPHSAIKERILTEIATTLTKTGNYDATDPSHSAIINKLYEIKALVQPGTA